MKKHPDPAEQTQKTFDKNAKAMSAMDCTGLAPFGVSIDAQSGAYRDLYDIHPPKGFKEDASDVRQHHKRRRKR